MRKGVFVAGIVLLFIGGLIVGISFLTDSSSNTIPSPATHQALTFSPNFIGSGTVALSWSDATSQFRFQVYQCASSSCSAPASSSPVANGAGASGTVSFTASGGQYFLIDAQQNGDAVPVTITLSGGLTPLLLVGIVVAVLGAAVAFLGYRAKAKPKTIYEEDHAPKRDSFVTTSMPFTGEQEATAASAGSAASASSRERTESPESTSPVYFQPAEGQESYGSNEPAAAPKGGVRPPIKCPSCGAMNEPWITNCRNCRRPLSSTGG
jgi:hypothetical protein